MEMLKAVLPSLTALHINANSGDHDLHCIPNCVSYMEKVDWKEFSKILKGSDYKGSFNMELTGSPFFNDKAKVAFYTVAYEVASYLIG